MTRYKLKITEEQAQVIKQALEFYGRIYMGQLEEVCSFLPTERIKDLDVYCTLRNKLRELEPLFTGLGSSNASYGIMSPEISENARIVWDVYQVIRYRLAWDREPNPQGLDRLVVDRDPFMACSQTPKPSIDKTL